MNKFSIKSEYQQDPHFLRHKFCIEAQMIDDLFVQMDRTPEEFSKFIAERIEGAIKEFFFQ